MNHVLVSRTLNHLDYFIWRLARLMHASYESQVGKIVTPSKTPHYELLKHHFKRTPERDKGVVISTDKGTDAGFRLGSASSWTVLKRTDRFLHSLQGSVCVIDVFLISIPASWLDRRSCQSKSFARASPSVPGSKPHLHNVLEYFYSPFTVLILGIKIKWKWAPRLNLRGEIEFAF